jgi:hypothetical protein
MVVNHLLAYLEFCISLSRARLRLSPFRIRLSLSWLSLSRAPTGLTFSLTIQVWCKAIARPHSVPLGQRTQSRACSRFAEPQPTLATHIECVAKVQRLSVRSKFSVQNPPFLRGIFRANFARNSQLPFFTNHYSFFTSEALVAPARVVLT